MSEKPNEITLLYLEAVKDSPDGPKTKNFVKKVWEIVQSSFNKLDKPVVNDDIKKDIIETLELVKAWAEDDLILPKLEELNRRLWQGLISARGECITTYCDLDLARKIVYDILTNLTGACIELSGGNKESAFQKLVKIINCEICNLKLYAKGVAKRQGRS